MAKDDQKNRGSPRHADSAAVRASGLRVLIVEDDLGQRVALAALLERWGHQVQTAPDGPAGVAKALSRLPDVAIVDLGLPGFNGLEVARRLRAGLYGHPMRLVAMTGFQGDDYRPRALAAGFDEFLPKPLQSADLERVLAPGGSSPEGGGGRSYNRALRSRALRSR